MHQQQVKLLGVKLELHPDMSRQRPQVRPLPVPDHLVSVRNRLNTVGLLLIRLIGTTAVIAGATDPIVIVARKGRDAPATDSRNDFVRPDIITYKVAKTINSIRLLLVNAGKKASSAGRLA